jgi:predicted SprT family Zn-dependent metalloprotease
MTLFILLTIIVLLCIFIVFKLGNDSVSIVSSVDNNKYIIRRGKGKSVAYLQESADTLATIHVRVTKLIQHLNTKFTEHPVLKVLQARYNHRVLSEAAIDERYTSFTVDKKEMHICLRTRDDKEMVYDIDLLMYVVLHELAHIANFDPRGKPIEGHGEEFIKIFKFLVTEAVESGVYEYTNYDTRPIEYCGMMITTQIV